MNVKGFPPDWENAAVTSHSYAPLPRFWRRLNLQVNVGLLKKAQHLCAIHATASVVHRRQRGGCVESRDISLCWLLPLGFAFSDSRSSSPARRCAAAEVLEAVKSITQVMSTAAI